MANKRSNRKKQTQLAFTPLQASPRREEISSTTDRKAAHVRYESSPFREQPLERSSSNYAAPSSSLEAAIATTSPVSKGRGSKGIGIPTPLASSQQDGVADSDGDDGDLVTSSSESLPHPGPSHVNRRTGTSVPKRSATSFFNPPSSSPTRASPPAQSPPRSKLKSQSSIFKRTPRKDISDDDSDVVLPSRLKRRQKHQVAASDDESGSSRTKVAPPQDQQDVDSDDSPILSEPRRITEIQPFASSSDAQLETSHPPTVTANKFLVGGSSRTISARSSRRCAVRNQDSVQERRNSVSFKELRSTTISRPASSPQVKRATRSNTSKVTPIVENSKRASYPIEITSDVGTDDSGEDFASLGRPLQRHSRKTKAAGTCVVDEDEDDEVDEGEDEDARPPRSSRKKTRPQLVSDDDSYLVESPTKRRRRNSPTATGKLISSQILKNRRQEQEDLDEDLDFLNDNDSTPDSGRIKKLTEKEQRRLNLEKMKARRDKKPAPASSPNNEVSELDEVDEDEWDAAHDVQPGYSEDLDEYEDEFVVDEGTDAIGAADLSEMPLEFTRHAHEGAKYHFRFVVEWMVHNNINPAFQRKDPIYRMAFQKVDDEARGYSNSKLMSAIWKPEFNRALRARPIFTEIEMGGAADFVKPHCAACNRTSHPASFRITLSGKAYHPETLENLKEDKSEDETSDESDDDQSVDVNGQELPDEEHEFYLGSFCKANSARAHALLHWKWHLNDWILDWLQNRGYTSPEHVVERENWSSKKRTKFANKVVDEMVEEEVKNLWRDFKNQLSEAREQKLYR